MNKENFTESDVELLNRLNIRALKLSEIYDHFDKNKIGLDKAYLDTLSDEKINEIYKTYCNGKL